jgi:orotate phosphoribosyltransferase
MSAATIATIGSPIATGFSECEHLQGRMRQICRGEAGLPLNGPNSTNSYREKLWQLAPLQSQAVGPVQRPFSPSPIDRDRAQQQAFPCAHRGEVVRQDESNLCGSRGDQINIFKCALHGECSIARYCQHQEVPACNRCGDRKPPEETQPRQRYRRRGHHPLTPQHGTPRFISTAQLMDDTKRLATMLPSDTAKIVGVARSGLCPATMVAMLLHLPLEIVRESTGDIIDAGNGWRIEKQTDGKGRVVVVVDDNVMTGNSLKKIKPIVQQQYPDAIFATVYVNPEAHTHPDLFVSHLKWPSILEWNMFNSVMSMKSLAVDFDGILCEDCPPGSDDDGPKYLDFLRNTKPLYPMRKDPIPLIVTARLEKYRAETEVWLARHGMRAGRLIMGPWGSLAERYKDPNAVADFKARHFAEFMRERHRMRPVMFVESEERQAMRIAEVSHGIVICPAAGRCYP